MRPNISKPRTVHPLARAVSWLGFSLLLGMLWLGQSGSSQARLDPYYVVRGAAFGTTTPRVLFVLDTSGSMSLRANEAADRCRWSRCENPAYYNTDEESRISAARRAIQEVVAGAGSSADFSLMTFVQNTPETDPTPEMCDFGGTDVRFVWVNEFRAGGGSWPDIRRHEPGVGDYRGGVRLCQGEARRPYAYIRWDELGNGSVIGANNQVGAVPPSPLISMVEADYASMVTYQRRVQFFPRFMGVRAQLNNTTDPGGDILADTVGDYDQATEVWNNDFYYWPYVDGFSGYGNDRVRYDDGSSVSYFEGSGRAGISSDEDSFPGVSLHAPFYVDLSSTAIPADNWGPASAAESLQETLYRTAPITEGGVDAVSNTPWASAVGDVPGAPPQDNRADSHPSVASYLAFLADATDETACTPTNVVLLTDGEPSSGEGGSLLYQRLAGLRNTLGAQVYVVGFFLGDEGELNHMACAAAGACDGGACGSPCDDTPAEDWDTCQDPDNPGTACAYEASSTAELQAVLAGIIDGALEVEVDSGQASAVNEFGLDGTVDDADAIQTVFTASTDYPGWQGHVERRYCSTVDGVGDLLPACQPPVPEFAPDHEAAFTTFGPCTISRDWDAAECLQMMDWRARRVYSHDATNDVYRISNPDGTASAEFVTELTTLGHVGGATAQDEADEIVAFLLGRDAVGGWKLPGVSNSAPVTVRRIPMYDEERLPEVPINDPHCAGRVYGDLDAGTLPDSLETFSQDAWDEDEAPNYTYQEAVVIGDDFGIVHAFQLDSGNELFGILPRFAIENAVAQAANGPINMGQPAEDLENHIYGVSSTLNHGWAFDTATTQWRHVGVIGMGAGGHEFIALDFSHMNPDAGIPVDVLWTTEDTDDARNLDYDDLLGETWARPALSYHPTNDQIGSEPATFLVAGSGYPESGAPPGSEQGRTLFVADALTGDLLERIPLPDVVDDVYESSFGAVVDPAVGSHCISRYWAEAQETYIADPAGRLFRWDLGRDTDPLTFKHEADSGGAWAGVAGQVARFPACTGTGDTCSVNSGNPGDPFTFGPAVTPFNRIDDVTAGPLVDVEENDQFLIALVSGSPNDDSIDGGDPDNDFHTSLYLLADDHSSDMADGFNIPAGAPTSGGAFGAGDAVSGNPGYMRIAVSDITRTRTVTPYEGATEFSETREFSKTARPVRAPRIYVTGVVDNDTGTPVVIPNVEVYYVSYYIYEPGSATCDARFYDSDTGTWHADRGTTYEITFRLTADSDSGFEFNSGSNGGSSPVDFGAGFQTGLELVSVEQQSGSECESGNCGASVAPTALTPCNNNDPDVPPPPPSSYVIPMASKTLDAFTPVEN